MHSQAKLFNSIHNIINTMATQTILCFLLISLQITSFLRCATSINTTQILKGLTLKMVHRDSPHSPMYRPNLTYNERINEYVQRSKARVGSLAKSHVPKNKSLIRTLDPNDVIIRPALGLQSLFYMVQVGIGTFENESPRSKTYYLGLDTGSDLVWTQCEGCLNECFHQVDPLYPAAQSSTYSPFPCSHCPLSATCHNVACRFQRTYTDDSSVIAVAATEVFTFASDGGGSQPIKDVIFGCGVSMQNFHEGNNPNNKISGIIGMGYGYFGFVEQSELMFDGKFSYCLQPFYNQGVSPMYLRFGNDAMSLYTSEMKTTPLYRYQDRPMYYLNLQGISVGDLRLMIPASLFSIKRDGSGGCVIDTGTATSWIITMAYQIFESAVRSFILNNNKNLREMAVPEMAFDRCYERFMDPRTIYLPTITYHFENADYVIDTRAAFYIGSSARSGLAMVCMQFFESTTDHNQVTYLGVLQQENHRFIYDTHNSLLHFAPDDCSKAN